MSKLIIDELVTLLGFDLKSNAAPVVEQFTQKIVKVQKAAVWASTGLLAASTGALAFITHAQAGSAELQKFHDLTGVSIKGFQELSFAVAMTGGDTAALAGDLKGLLASFNSPYADEFNETMFRFFGDASFRKVKDMTVLMDMIQHRLQAFPNKVLQFEWLKKLGIGDELGRLLMKTTERYEALKKEAEDFPLILSEDQTAAALKFEIQLSKIHKIIDFFGADIATSITPIITGWIEKLSNYIRQHKDEIQGNLSSIIKGVVQGMGDVSAEMGGFLDMVSNGVPGLSEWWDGLNKVEKAATAVKWAFNALALSAGFKVVAGIAGVVGWPVVLGVGTAAGILYGGKKALDAAKDSGLYTAEEKSNLGTTTKKMMDLWHESLEGLKRGDGSYGSSIYQMRPSHQAGGVNGAGNKVSVEIIQHITGANAQQIAESSSQKISYSLRALFPGENAPVVS